MPLSSSITSMQRMGIRRVLIVSGDTTWHRQVIEENLSSLQPNVLWVGENAPEGTASIATRAARGLLGQELAHVVFNAAEGVNAEALAAVSGAMSAGHWLILLVPDWEQWPCLPDMDSLRWSEQAEPIATPYFVRHFQRVTSQHPDIIVWKQGEPKKITELQIARPEWQRPDGSPTREQEAILRALLTNNDPVSVVIGERGRGKSTLAGMFAARTAGVCWVTGPNRVSTQVLSQCGTKGEFHAPDMLLEQCRQKVPENVDWLLIDEAAAIPAPMLSELISFFPHVLLTTTVQGYEGTGRGFLLKFCSSLPSCQIYSLEQPMRWALHDPLEAWVGSLLLFAEPQEPFEHGQKLKQKKLSQNEWHSSPQVMSDFYALLTSAHYKTTPLDLRRLMDGVGNHLHASFVDSNIVAALWAVDEGGLDESLAKAVWAGERRPKGNLVAQSLAAHGGQWVAAVLRSRRISRIAVFPEWRRQGVAKSLVAAVVHQARQEQLDFVSVSFGYTPELHQFWQRCGFQLVRFGTHLEASSGCYTAMAILPLSEKSQPLLRRLQLRLQRDGYFIEKKLNIRLPINVKKDLSLNQDDCDELHGFAHCYRPFDVSVYALSRYANHLSDDELSCFLKSCINESGDVRGLCDKYKISGKKELITRLRTVLASILNN